jgi:hypothetical protein
LGYVDFKLNILIFFCTPFNLIIVAVHLDWFLQSFCFAAAERVGFLDFPVANEKNNYLGYESETIRTNLNQYIHMHLQKTNRKCFDIRSREIRNKDNINFDNAQLFIRQYHSKNAIDYFISVEIPNNELVFDDCILLGFLRLRILKQKSMYAISSIRNINIARIREVHVYGFISNTEQKMSIQHLGIGKFLLKIAEYISYRHSCKEIVVISGVGVRKYYKKFGYSVKENDLGEYLFKNISNSFSFLFGISLFNSLYLYPFLFHYKNPKTYVCNGIGWKCYACRRPPRTFVTIFFLIFIIFIIGISNAFRRVPRIFLTL